MNCLDIAHTLDERGDRALSVPERTAFEAHLAACADCAAQYRASVAVASLRPGPAPLPASLYERARQLQDLRQTPLRERRTRRPVIIGSLLLLGAATMFAAVPWSDTAER